MSQQHDTWRGRVSVKKQVVALWHTAELNDGDCCSWNEQMSFVRVSGKVHETKSESVDVGALESRSGLFHEMD